MPPTDAEKTDGLEGLSYRELRLLEEVDSTPEVSQRHLSNQLGVALGVTNILLRNLAKKGYIRSSQVAWRRWVYVLTPSGITRKVYLTLTYIERFLDHYRRVRALVKEDLDGLTITPESRIAIYGTSELTELIYLSLRDMGITNIDIYSQGECASRFLGMRVYPLESLKSNSYAKVMLAFSGNQEVRRRELEDAGVDSSQIVALLHTSKVRRG